MQLLAQWKSPALDKPAQDFCFHMERGNVMENVQCKSTQIQCIYSKGIETKF